MTFLKTSLLKKVVAACVALPLALACSSLTSMAQSKLLPYQNPKLSPEARAADLVSRMTLQQKIAQTVNAAPAIPSLGVPAYNYWSEALHGVAFSGYATMFPQAIGNGATWDAPLVHQEAEIISTEARAKYNWAIRHNIHSIFFGLTLWAPNINMFRDPRWGRGQETYGEDPYLTGRMAVAFVTGIQGTNPHYLKAVATPKHFDLYSGPEPLRHRINNHVSPYDFEATYLPAFRAAIVKGHADSIMCSYNAVDGTPACANTMLLQQTLRDDWGFKGFVTSDCGAIDDFYSPTGHHYSSDAAHASASGILAGTDTNCGDTYSHALGKAIKEGLLPVSALNTAVERLFTARFRLGMFDPASMDPYARIPFSANDTPAHRAVALKEAEESMVLLKNDGTLPLKPGTETIAVVGPNAASLAGIEGNYHATAKNPSLPLYAMSAEFPNAKIIYAQGSAYDANAPVPMPETVFHPSMNSTVQGLKAQYFSSTAMTGTPVLTRVDHQVNFNWDAASPAPGVPANDFGVRWTGTITAPAPGAYTIEVRLQGCYPCGDVETYKLYVDGKQVGDYAPAAAPYRSAMTPPITLYFDNTKPHSFELEYTHKSKLYGAGITLAWMPPAAVLRRQAVEAAKKADVIVAFMGLTPHLVGEEMPVYLPGFNGGDRTSLKLPRVQRQLLKALGATGKPLVVVLMNGGALAVNWAATHANAILEAWYPGEAGGEAIAKTLSGANNPGGRLPVTFYRSVKQLPPFTDYSMKGRTFRYFHGDPLYPFGYGLSYTSFAFSHLTLSSTDVKAGDDLDVSAEVTNTGKRAGDEVAELYITPPQNGLWPIRELKGFTRIHLAPGESQTVHFTLHPRQLSLVNEAGQRAVRPGSYSLFVGGSQPASGAAGVSEPFSITGTKALPR